MKSLPPSLLPLGLALLLALPLSALLAGCGGGGSSSSASSASTVPAAPLSVSAATPSGLTATLAEDKSATSAGSSVIYTLTLTNNTSQPITFTPVSSATTPASTAATAVGGSLTITSRSGGIVYPPTNNGTTHGGGQIGPTATLASGQSAVGTATPGSVLSTPGSYTASASFVIQASNGTPNNITTVGPLTVTVQ